VSEAPYTFDDEGNGFTPQAQGNDAGSLPPTFTGATDGALGTSLFIVTLILLMAALQSSFVLLRTANPDWPHLSYGYGWWIVRGLLLWAATGLLLFAARGGARSLRYLLIASGLAVTAAYAVAMEHGHIAKLTGMKAASHNAYACYYLITGAEGVMALGLAFVTAVVALLFWRGKMQASSLKNLGMFGVFLTVLWAVQLALFTVYNGVAP